MRFREVGEVINRHASMSGFSVVISNFNANVHQFNLYAMTEFLLIPVAFLLCILGKIVLRSRNWRTVSLCTKYSSLQQYPEQSCIWISSCFCFSISLTKVNIVILFWWCACDYILRGSLVFLALTQVGNKAVGVMKAGQTFTIEPMINTGKIAVYQVMSLTIQT